MRLSQNSTCEKNSRCRQPDSCRSLAIKNGVRCASHFWPQCNKSQGVSEFGELLEAFGLSASREGIGTLLEVDALLPQAVGQPMMLVEADPGGERCR